MWWNRSHWRAVAKVGDVPPGGVIAIAIDGVELVLGLAGDRYFAVQRWCAHRQADLMQGFVTGDRLVCRQHGWRFSTKTGENDGLFDACLAVYPVRVVGDQIEIDPVAKKRPR